MKVERYYVDCLSQASYLISVGNEAAIVDPIRDVDMYLDVLEQEGLKLKYILETHLHADFISGHVELASQTGASIVISKRAAAEFEHIGVDDGDQLELGGRMIRVLATPGHTPESICYLLEDKVPHVFTGDTLFAGDVGRPDLLDKTVPGNRLAEMLYFSLRDKLMTLPDETIVHPAHGAGSSCGRDLSDVEYTTIGQEKESNYALQPMDIEEFVKQVTENQPIPPAYFFRSAQINRRGAPDLRSVLRHYVSLSLQDFLASKESCVVLDVRDEDEYAIGHIPGSIHIGLSGRYAEWVGSLVDTDSEIIVVSPEGKEEEAAIRCARVGFDNVRGYLSGGYSSWENAGLPIQSFRRISPETLTTYDVVVDIRRFSERALNRVKGSIHIPLHELEQRIDDIPIDHSVVVYCAGGYRSVIASSILLKYGRTNVADVRGGMDEILNTSPELVDNSALLIS